MEEDLMTVVALRDRAEVEPAALFEFFRTQLPSYMVPEYLRIHDGPLPRSGSNKIEKFRLSETGVTADTYRRPRPVA
jgi:acyl-CoA synthetase (AMP-forming)/AMP-acid ligase II